MRTHLLCLYLLVPIYCTSTFAQNIEEIALQSLDYLNEQFHLNLKKMNEPVLITINNTMYVCNEYVEKSTLVPLYRLRLQYEIRNEGYKYRFVLRLISEYRGSFDVVENEGRYTFRNLNYVMRNH